MDKNNEVCERIDWIRRNRKMSQEQLARALQISQPAVSNYLKNRIPPADILLKLARLGGTTVEWLLSGEKNYLYTPSPSAVHETQAAYDAELAVSRKISALPSPLRQAVIHLIDALTDQCA